MPDPTKHVRAKSGIWLRWEMPNQLEYEVLCHLASNPMSRAYLGHYEVGVSNDESTGAVGWHRRGAIHGLDNFRHGWVEIDKALAKKQKRGSVKPHRITKKGFQAIAQYRTRQQVDRVVPEYTRRLLVRYLKDAYALVPKR